jgi:HEAT repeat protein
VKQAIHDGGVVTGSDAYWLGRGQHPDQTDGLDFDAGITRAEILPTLLALLETQRNKDLLASCLISVAKIGEDARVRGSNQVRSTILPFLGYGNRQVAEAAILALGILGSDEAAPSLAQLLEDTAAGRALCRQDSVNERARAFAAYSLGLIGQRTQREDVRRFVVNRLCAMFDHGRRATHDVQVACLLGAGLVPLASDSTWIATKGQRLLAGQCHEAQVAWMLRLLSDRSQSFLVRAHVPTSLARLTQGLPGDSVLKANVVRAVLAQIGPGARAEREVEQSCVLALGQLADADEDPLDREVRERLLDIGKQVVDQQARAFALISLGQIGGHPGAGAGDALAGSNEIRSHLAKQLTGGKNFLQPWAALGIGVMERALADQGQMSSEAMVSSVRSSLKSARSPTLVGALSISLGLMRDVGGVQTLLATLDRHRHVETRAFAMLALGMIGARESIAPIQGVLEESEFQPFLVHNASRGLALMRDLDLVPNLIEMLETSSSHASRVSVAFALGSVGDRRAVGALSSMALDMARPELTRGMAAEALGEVAHKDDLPWNTSLSVNANYRAATMTLSDPYATAILDMY